MKTGCISIVTCTGLVAKTSTLLQGAWSIAGIPKVVNVTVMWPHLVAQNPAKIIDSTKEYDIIIIEREKK